MSGAPHIAAYRAVLCSGSTLPTGRLGHNLSRPLPQITHFRGAQVAAAGVGVWNPAFDVAPGKLIAGIITEAGMVPKAAGEFQVRA